MEDVVKMVRTNRECHPGGDRVYMISASQAERQELRYRRAQEELLELQLRTRLSTLAIIGVCCVSALAGFLMGMLV